MPTPRMKVILEFGLKNTLTIPPMYPPNRQNKNQDIISASRVSSILFHSLSYRLNSFKNMGTGYGFLFFVPVSDA